MNLKDYEKNFVIIKNSANPDKNMIPAKLKIFSNIEGWASFARCFPVTSFKLKIAIIGAIRNDNTVAKSTSSFRLLLNSKIMNTAPIAITSKKIT